jgi:hypothetical protein
VLVETAQERDEPIPALVYNASVLIMMLTNSDEEDSDKGDLKRGKQSPPPKVKSTSPPVVYKDEEDDDEGTVELDENNRPDAVAADANTVEVGNEDNDDEPIQQSTLQCLRILIRL